MFDPRHRPRRRRCREPVRGGLGSASCLAHSGAAVTATAGPIGKRDDDEGFSEGGRLRPSPSEHRGATEGRKRTTNGCHESVGKCGIKKSMKSYRVMHGVAGKMDGL